MADTNTPYQENSHRGNEDPSHEEQQNEIVDTPPANNHQFDRIRRMIRENPGQSTFILVATILTICPALLTGPLMAILGFTAAGPALGSIAAGVQSVVGTPWIFRLLQSAAMGGWGAGVVAGIVRVASVGGTLINLIKAALGGFEEEGGQGQEDHGEERHDQEDHNEGGKEA